MGEHLAREQAIVRRTLQENPGAAGLLDAIFEPFQRGYELLNSEVKVEDVRIETAQLLAMAANSLRWSHQQALTGYYAPSVLMARNAYECWIHGQYLNLYPERLSDWKAFETRPTPTEMQRLVAAKMAPDDKEHQTELATAMAELYRGRKGTPFTGFSAFSHPSWESIRILIATDAAGGLSLRAGPDYDQGLFITAADLFYSAGIFSASLFIWLLEEQDLATFMQTLDDLKLRLKAWRERLTEPSFSHADLDDG